MTVTAAIPRPRGRRRWLAIAAAAWALVLVAAAVFSALRGPASFRDQIDLRAAQPVVDRAVGALAAGAGPDAIPRLLPVETTRGCRLTPFREGGTLRRRVLVYAAPERTAEVLSRIAATLPAGYEARVSARQTLRADAGSYVSIRGKTIAPGVLELSASTGCRPTARLAEAGGSDPDAEPARTAADRALSALRLASGARTVARAPCPNGGTLRTVSVRASGEPLSPPLGTLLAPPRRTGSVVVDRAGLYAFRTAEAGVAVDAAAGVVTASATTGC